MIKTHWFLQIGASRDGLDAYLAAARRRGLRAVLAETPDYLAYRATLPGRPAFDFYLGVERPAEVANVLAALERLGEPPALVLAGFERYVEAAYETARRLNVVPAADGRPGRFPCDKGGQRRTLTARAPEVSQPRFAVVSDLDNLPGVLAEFPYPAVIKVVNGAGGLGVYRADDCREALAGAERLAGLRNYDGSPFAALLVEERIEGSELSVQAVARDGQPELLAFCTKVITPEPDRVQPGLYGFRERAHLARPGDEAPSEVVALVRRCLQAFGYQNGPFHIDLIRDRRGMLHFLEMGYRLSGGGLVTLLERLTSRNWGELSFGWLLERAWPAVPPGRRPGCVGQCLLATLDELDRACRLRAARGGVEVYEMLAAPPPEAAAARLPTLAADLHRHAGFLGRARVAGDSHDEVAAVVNWILTGEEACAGYSLPTVASTSPVRSRRPAS